MFKRFLSRFAKTGEPAEPGMDGTASLPAWAHTAPRVAAADGQVSAGARSATPANLTQVSLSGLQAQRQVLDQQQRQTFADLQQLQADCKGVVARYARARVDGRPTELQALERVYGNIKSRLKTAELRHADQLTLLTLLDRMCVLREDLQAREGLQQGALAGVRLTEVKAMLAHELAALLSNRNQVQDLLDELDVHDEDARLQGGASTRAVRDELMALTEPEVECAVAAHLAPLDQVAQQLDRSLAQRAGASSLSATATEPARQEAFK